MVINTNVASLFAENAVSNTTNSLYKLEQELSTGYQINTPGDNPSGLAIATLMSGELGGITAAVGNGNQALNLLQTANGGIQNDVQIVTQIQQLATQGANSTETTQNQQQLQNEITSLISQLDNNAKSINYNQQTLLNGNYSAKVASVSITTVAVSLGADSANAASGSYSVAFQYSTAAGDFIATLSQGATTLGTVTLASTVSSTSSAPVTVQFVQGTSSDSGSVSINASFTPVSVAGTSVATVAGFSVVAATNPLSFQVGPSDHSYNRVQTYLGQFNSVTLGLNNLTVVGSSTAQTGNAEYAINLAQNALSILTNAQGQIGAQQDQLTYTIQNLQTENTNLQAARSTIMDANMANVSSNFAREQILQQTGLQALAAANQMPGLVLKLLG